MTMKNRGFTLIELLMTVAIIGILASIAIPMFIGQNTKARRTEASTNLQNIALIEAGMFADSGVFVAGDTTTAANVTALKTALPKFQPGAVGATGLYDALFYTYTITNVAGVGLPTPVALPYVAGVTAALVPATTPCFIATASGKAGTRVSGDKFAIDCNNNKNF